MFVSSSSSFLFCFCFLCPSPPPRPLPPHLPRLPLYMISSGFQWVSDCLSLLLSLLPDGANKHFVSQSRRSLAMRTSCAGNTQLAQLPENCARSVAALAATRLSAGLSYNAQHVFARLSSAAELSRFSSLQFRRCNALDGIYALGNSIRSLLRLSTCCL